MIPPSILLNDDTARARRRDPITSHEAADTNDVTRSIGWVLSVLYTVGPMADHEVEALARRWDVNFTGQRLRTARAALVRQGKSPSRGCTGPPRTVVERPCGSSQEGKQHD